MSATTIIVAVVLNLAFVISFYIAAKRGDEAMANHFAQLDAQRKEGV